VTVVSAPPGSGKTSLLRAWLTARPAFVGSRSCPSTGPTGSAALLVRGPGRDPQPARSIDPEAQPAPTAALDADQLVDRLVSELAEQVEAVVLIIDDLHELKSADALAQLERLLAILPSSASVVLSSRRDPPIRLHQLRLATRWRRFGQRSRLH